jgi:hypothetical protein
MYFPPDEASSSFSEVVLYLESRTIYKVQKPNDSENVFLFTVHKISSFSFCIIYTLILKLVVCILLRVLGQVHGFRLTQHCFE